MKSVEMWPFVRTKHACSCAKEYQRCIQWPQRWCNVNEQSLLKMQKVTSLLQKGKGIPDFVTCKSTELLRPWEARCMSQVAAVHQCDQAAFRTWPATCCIVQTAPQMAVFHESLPPWSERFARWSPVQKRCWKHTPELAVDHFPQHKLSSTEFCLSWLLGLHSLWILHLMMNSGQLQWWWADSWACLALASL